MGLNILKTPVRTPTVNAYCERIIGAIRRECLDFMIPLNEKHLPSLLKKWKDHYNRGRPHSSLGPGPPILMPFCRQSRSQDMLFHVISEWLPSLFLVDCIMNIDSRE